MDTELFNMGWLIGEIAVKNKARQNLIRAMKNDGWSKLGKNVWVRACCLRSKAAERIQEWEKLGVSATFVCRASWERSLLRHGDECHLPENDPTGKVIIIPLDGSCIIRTHGTLADLPSIMETIGAGRVLIAA